MNPTWLFVAGIYGAAVALARRTGTDLPWRIAIFFYALVLVFFWSAMTGPYVNVAVDNTIANPPWSWIRHDRQVSIPELTDHATQIVPWAHLARENWKSLTAPIWNPHAASGYPLLGNAQSAALSLLRIVTLPLNLGHSMTAEGALKVLIALTFTFLYCRRRYSLLASSLAAVTFGFSAFIIGWLHFPVGTTAALAPAVLYCIDLLVERITFPRFVFSAVVLAQIVVSGHPEVAAHLFWLGGIYALWLIFVTREATERKQFVVTLMKVALVAILLAAPYLWMLTQTMSKSWRRVALQAVPFAKRVIPHTDINAAIITLQPHFFGQLPFDVPWAQASVESIGGFAGVFGVACWLAMAVWVIASRKWRTREAFFALLTLFAIGVIFAWPGFTQLFHWSMPVAAHSRLRYLLALLLAIQSAAALDLARRIPMLAGIAAVAATLLALLHLVPFALPYHFDTAVLAMLPSVAVLALATAVAVTRHRAAVLLLMVAVVAELFLIGRDRATPLHERRMYPVTPLITKLQELKAATPANEPWRMVGIGPQFFPQAAAMYGLEDIRGHDPMSNARYLGFLMLTAKYDPWNYFATFQETSHSVYNYLNVKYLLVDPWSEVKDPERYGTVYHGPDGRILENRDVLPRFYAVRNVVLEWQHDAYFKKLGAHRDWATTVLLNDIELEKDQQNKDFFDPRPADSPLATSRIISASATDYTIEVNAPRWTMVASSIPWYHGWKIRRNGDSAPPMRINGEFLGFAVPPGKWTVRVWFAPWSWWLGVWISLGTMVYLGWVGWRRKVWSAEAKTPL